MFMIIIIIYYYSCIFQYSEIIIVNVNIIILYIIYIQFCYKHYILTSETKSLDNKLSVSYILEDK